eukprot:g54599.t1
MPSKRISVPGWKKTEDYRTRFSKRVRDVEEPRIQAEKQLNKKTKTRHPTLGVKRKTMLLVIQRCFMSLGPEQRRVLEAICEAFLPKLSEAQVEEVAKNDAEFWAARGQAGGSERRRYLEALCHRNAKSLKIAAHVEETLSVHVADALKRKVALLFTAMSTSVGMLLLAQTPVRFYELPLPQRQQVLLDMSKSLLPSKRQAFLALKAAVLSKFFAVPHELPVDAWAAVGFRAPLSNAQVEAEVKQAGWQEYLFTMENRTLTQDTDLKVDVVIVGSGCGAGVMAAGLSKGRNVLLLEKAKYFPRAEMPGTEAHAFSNMYEAGGTLRSMDSNMFIFAGSGFGGGSAINWACCLRTPSYVRQEWSSQYGLKRFGPLSGAFTEALDAVSARLQVRDAVAHNSANQLMLEGCRRCGYGVKATGQNMKTVGSAAMPRGNLEVLAAGATNLGDRYGIKNSGPETFLQDAAKQGCRFMDQCFIEKVLYKPVHQASLQAVGVVGSVMGADGQTRYRLRVHAPVVIVACGSLHSPALLLRSGLPNRNGMIGRNLRLHPVAVMRALMPRPVKVWEGAPMTTVSDAGAAGTDGSHYGVKLEVPVATPSFMGTVLPWRGPVAFLGEMLRAQNLFLTIALVRDKGSGRVTLDANGAPSIAYPLDRHDRQQLVAGIGMLARISAAVGAEALSTSLDVDREPCLLPPAVEYSEQADATRQSAVEDFVTQLERVGVDTSARSQIVSAHQMGTCRMSIDPGQGVVDDGGQVWECNSLYVADASVFPTPSGANPMLTTLALCFDFAKRLDARLRHATPDRARSKL